VLCASTSGWKSASARRSGGSAVRRIGLRRLQVKTRKNQTLCSKNFATQQFERLSKDNRTDTAVAQTNHYRFCRKQTVSFAFVCAETSQHSHERHVRPSLKVHGRREESSGQPKELFDTKGFQGTMAHMVPAVASVFPSSHALHMSVVLPKPSRMP